MTERVYFREVASQHVQKTQDGNSNNAKLFKEIHKLNSTLLDIRVNRLRPSCIGGNVDTRFLNER